jgi:hypothetical protein
MVPNLINLKSRTIEEFGNLVRHPGEEFIYVVSGRIVVHTEFYDPVALDTGECMYIDSEMGHAYLLGEDCSDATVMTVMSSVADGLMAALISNASDQRRD